MYFAKHVLCQRTRLQGLNLAQIYGRMEGAGATVTLRIRSHPLEQTNTMERRLVSGQLEKLGLTFFAGVIIRIVPSSPAARLGKDLIDHVLVAVNGMVARLPQSSLAVHRRPSGVREALLGRGWGAILVESWCCMP